jgi:hypothetical protein
MWRLEPESNISVFVKSNSEQHIHAECGRRGTITIEPEHRLPLPPVRAGERIRTLYTPKLQVPGYLSSPTGL